MCVGFFGQKRNGTPKILAYSTQYIYKWTKECCDFNRIWMTRRNEVIALDPS